MTKHEIIDETVEFYSNNPRSLDEEKEHCLYKGPNNTECAFARMVRDEDKVNLKEGWTAKALLNGLSIDIIKDEYKGYEFDFYNDIQALHDTKRYWKSGGLTDYGKEKVVELKREYK